MVKRSIIFLVLLVTTAYASEEDSYEGGSYDNYWVPRPYKVTQVKSLAIDENGARSDDGTYEPHLDCKKFILRESDVAEYFKKAKIVSHGDFMHQLNWAPCYARGTVKFANGDKGTWNIQRYRIGSLKLSDGRKVYFNCPKCRAKAFSSY